MRNLYENEKVKEQIIKYRSSRIVFNNLNIIAYDIPYGKNYCGMIICKDLDSGEFLKYPLSWGVEIYNRSFKITNDYPGSIHKSVNIFNTNYILQQYRISYIKENITSGRGLLKSKIDNALKPAFIEYEEMLESYLKKIILNNEYYDEKMLNEFIRNNTNLDKVVKDAITEIGCDLNVIKILTEKDFPFEGSFHVKRSKYNDNITKNFDIISIEIPMKPDYNNNLDFIKRNANAIKSMVIIPIFKNHKLSKKYAKFMRLFKLVLTRENILIAQFCFKEGLESKV